MIVRLLFYWLHQGPCYFSVPQSLSFVLISGRRYHLYYLTSSIKSSINFNPFNLADSLLAELARYYGLYDPIPRPISPWLTSSSDESGSPSADAFSRHLDSPQLTPTTPVSPLIIVTMTEPTFSFCGKFNSKTESASRWLKLLNYELRPLRAANTLISALYLQYIDLLLQGEAVE